MKPSWNDAPEWANYLAMDNNCEWWWYENKPELDNDVSEWDFDRRSKIQSVPQLNWEDSLEMRP